LPSATEQFLTRQKHFTFADEEHTRLKKMMHPGVSEALRNSSFPNQIPYERQTNYEKGET
jgi:hypothetical protein